MKPGAVGPADAKVVSVNVGGVRTVELAQRHVRTAIWKTPVDGAVRLHGVNFDGDDQADRSVHGGPDKAVYAYAAEDLEWWTRQLGHTIEPGTFGENLTTRGVDVNKAIIGEWWTVGSTLLEIRQPRIPCYKLGLRMGDRRFPARFAAAGRPGAYLGIVAPGEIRPGDAIRVARRPHHGLTVGDVERAYHADPSLAQRLLGAPELPEAWVRWARRSVDAAAR